MKTEEEGTSVGAVVEREGSLLMLHRKVFPQGLALPAGHINPGETPEEALMREVKEESGITVTKCQLVLGRFFPNPCAKGHTAHRWWVYRVTGWEGEPSVCEPEKHAFVKFMTKEEILAYLASGGDVDPAWKDFIFPALRMLS